MRCHNRYIVCVLTIHPILTCSNRTNLMLDKPPLIVSTQYPIGRSASSLEADKATVFDGLQVEIGELTHRLSTDRFFWLDIDGASAEELQTVTSVLQIAEPANS